MVFFYSSERRGEKARVGEHLFVYLPGFTAINTNSRSGVYTQMFPFVYLSAAAARLHTGSAQI